MWEKERKREDVDYRQGRSHKTRIRVMKEKIAQEKYEFILKIKKVNIKVNLYQCAKCQEDIVVDHLEKGGTRYCGSCGFETNELVIADQPEGNKRHVRQLYQPVVHFRQAIMSSMGKDPRVPLEDVLRIESYLLNNPEVMGKFPFYVGCHSIKRAITDLNLNSRYTSRWVQIRSRFTLENIINDVAHFDKETLERLGIRYKCVVKGFETMVKCKKGKAAKKPGVMRRNMINLSYVIPQLVRLESEELFRENARFFPIVISENQPALNNERWKNIISYCKKHFAKVYDKKDDSIISFEWEYIALTTKDVFDYFIIYR